MFIEVDTHVHTVLSGHAFSTIRENILSAKEKGLRGFCSTDHGPDLAGASPDFIPYTMRTWPDYMDDIRVYRSCEANIIGVNGELDYRQMYIDMLDFVAAGIHTMDADYFNKERTTKAYIAAYNNPYIDIVTHIDHDRYMCDFEAVIATAKKNNKPIEINNQSYLLREGSDKRIDELIQLCKEMETTICVSSDSHICYTIGEVSTVQKRLEYFDFPKELILNATIESFDAYLETRKKRLENK